MKLIVGLGNPGKEYENTRHNIGFYFIDNYVSKYNLGNFKSKDNGLFIKTRLFDTDIIFLKPQSFMNLSGEVVRKYSDFYKIKSEDILIISDDLDLLTGNFKLKSSGSSGGHNGLKNIEQHLGTDKYKRLKIGISNNKNIDTKDYVLGKINSEDSSIFEDMKSIIDNVLDDYFRLPFSDLMNKYNRKNR